MTVAPPPPTSAVRRARPHILSTSFRLCLILLSFFLLYLLYNPSPSIFRYYRRNLRSYQRLLHLHPLQSRAVTAGVIFFIADLISQILQTPPSVSFTSFFNPARLLRYSLYGLFLMGPFLYLWYALMNHFGPEDDLRGSLVKCIFEQFTLEPMCICMYIIYDAIVCTKDMQHVRHSFRSKVLPLWAKNALFWLPANFANYYIGTPDLRVVFANLCSLFWNIYFSAKVNHVSKRFDMTNHDREQHPHHPVAVEKENKTNNSLNHIAAAVAVVKDISQGRVNPFLPSTSERRKLTPTASLPKQLLV